MRRPTDSTATRRWRFQATCRTTVSIMSTPAHPPPLAIKRSFNWGILMLSDGDSKDVPEFDHGSTFATTPHALVVAVRHAQDVDYEALDLGSDDVIPPAEVSVRVAPGGPENADFSCVLDLPSGRLRVGDADHEDAVMVPPGRYSFAVTLDDIDHAGDVDVRWSSLSEATNLYRSSGEPAEPSNTGG